MNVYEEVQTFYAAYRGKKRVIGKSEDGRDIFAMLAGREAAPVAVSQYAIHGREWVTALLALEHLRRGVTHGGVWIVPLADPDGALLSEVGLSSLPPERRSNPLYAAELPLWKANARGVDLNVNFDARWGTGKLNRRTPASENYIGDAPFSAAETRVLRDFTLSVSPAYTVSWHTKGEVVYWEFHQPVFRRRRDRKYAQILSAGTGYPLVSAEGSAGGYKDWCIERLKIPAFTVEAGRESEKHPLTRASLADIASHTVDALETLNRAFSGG